MHDLDDMTIEQLRELRKNVDQAITSYETRTRQAALDAVEEVAREHGFKLADLVEGTKTGRKRASASADIRYVNPDNSDQTWSGRGRRPGWVKAALEAGRSLDELSA
ncbi:H-NS histone family protein [Paracoccus sp. Z118]|uniref:H-NS histone family protein n=1 Tax=Paracoccus sp. Z118 TaxID=2851017 RepID=UPI001C2BB013|nr:H-NS histone family protein [Paracoccus sp. Z118]MBV0892891.1 H-NS histone family protein [Paracoccus sp. Z118]